MVRNKLSEFVIETARFITSTADVSPELQQLRYCLCSVARQCGLQLGQALPAAFPDKASSVNAGPFFAGMADGLAPYSPSCESACCSCLILHFTAQITARCV